VTGGEAREGDRVVLEERVFAAEGSVRVRGTLVSRQARKRLARGRRLKPKLAPDTGRYVKARLPEGRLRSLAVDATLRAAAPHQVRRRAGAAGSPAGLELRPEDLREKVLARPSGVSLLFAVDASGSMAADDVMARAKGLVLSLLADAYQKRDRVGLLSFRGTEAPLVLPFTSSVEHAQRRLRDLPTGGKSPLGLALAKALTVFEREARTNPGRAPLLVLLTDGRANISLEGADPFEEALRHARRLRAAGIRSLVVDTDPTWIQPYAYARALAQAMDAKFLTLARLEAERLIDFVRLFGG
jgi:magnesium chelatase subunit D